MKNLCGKSRPASNPYEVWQSTVPVFGCPAGSWTWNVLKKYQTPEKEAANQYARWFCNVVTPICPGGELGDVYVSDIKPFARKIKENL
jgi:hypothetical protein